MEEEKQPYVLLDWGGGIEDEKLMTPSEAKALNQLLIEKEPRLLRWAPKYHNVKHWNGWTPLNIKQNK